MNERDALVRAVCENPDDDTPRLVFADWLQEHGDDARAEFIRTQIELSRLTDEDARWNELFSTSQRLQEKHAARWLGELPVPKPRQVDWDRSPSGWLGGEAFDRGFPARLLVWNTGLLAKYAKVLFAAAPVRRLMVWHMMKGEKLAAIPQLRHLHTFRVRIVSRQAADDILNCRHLDSVPDVRLSFTALHGVEIANLRKHFGDRLKHQP